MRLILKKGYPILKGDGNHGVHPVTGEIFYYGNPPPELFHSEQNPLHQEGYDRPLFSHYGELGIPQGRFVEGEFGEPVFLDEHGIQHRHGIDGVIFKVGMMLRKAGRDDLNPVDIVQESIQLFNKGHNNTEEHSLPDVDSPEWRRLRSMDFQHGRKTSHAKDIKVRGEGGTLATVFTNAGRGNYNLGKFHETYAIPFAPYLAALLKGGVGIDLNRYDEGITHGYISVDDLAINPQTGMPVGRRKRGSQSGETLTPQGHVNDKFLNDMGVTGGVKVPDVYSHEMIHHMPDDLWTDERKTGRTLDEVSIERMANHLLTDLDQSKIPDELLDSPITTVGGQMTLREALNPTQGDNAKNLIRYLNRAPSALHFLMGDVSQGVAKNIFDRMTNEIQTPEDKMGVDDMMTHMKAGRFSNEYHRTRKKAASHKMATQIMAMAHLFGESGEMPGVSGLRHTTMGLRPHPEIDQLRPTTEPLAAAMSHGLGHVPNRGLLSPEDMPTSANEGRKPRGLPTGALSHDLPEHLSQYHIDYNKMAQVPVADPQGQSAEYARVRQPPTETTQTAAAQTSASTAATTPSEEYRQAQEAFRYATPEQVRRVYVARSGLGQPGRAPAPTGPITPQEQRFQQTLSDPYQQTLDQYLRGDTAPVEDRLIKAMENLQYKDAANDDDVRKHLPSTRLSVSSEDDLSFMAERMSITKHDVRAIIFSKGDWHRVAKTFNMSPVIVKAVKVAFGGGADE